MKKVIVLLIIILTLFSLSKALALANVELSEVMYDLPSGSDSGREWVEVYNNSSSPVDISTFRLYEGGVNHKLKLTQGSASIPALGYAVIASDSMKFKADYPNFQGILFDSAFSLSNTGEILAVKDSNLIIIDQYAYSSTQGGAGDGNSLQKVNGAWQGAPPTPGAVNALPPVIVVPPSPRQNKPDSAKAPVMSPRLPQLVSGNSPKSQQQMEPSNTAKDSQVGTPTDHTSFLFQILLLIFLIICVSGVFLIRKTARKSTSGDDFEILK